MKKVLLSIMCIITVVIFSTSIISARGMGSDTIITSTPISEQTGVKLKHDFIPDNLMIDGQKEITREEFCSIIVNLYEYVTNSTVKTTASISTFSDTSNPYVIKAFELGIVLGVEDRRFLPQDNITIQEKATMLYRTIKKINPNLGTDLRLDFNISDEDQISPWALEAIKYFYNNKILLADSNNRINPLGTLSRDNSHDITDRVYNYVVTNGTKVNAENTSKTNNIGSVNLKETSPESPLNSVVTLQNRGCLVANTNNAYNFSTGDFTLEAWIKPTGAGTIISRKGFQGGPGNGGFLLVLRSNSTLKLATDNGYGFYEIDSAPTSAFDGKWHHIAGVRKNGTLQLYFDGKPLSSNVRSNVGTPLNVNNSHRLLIGSTDQYQEDYINCSGLLDEVRIWNISRSQSAIQEYMSLKPQQNEIGLVGYWNFDKKDGSDLSSVNNTVNPQGSVSYIEEKIS